MPSFESIGRPVPRHVIEIDYSDVLDVVRKQISSLELDLSGMTVVAGAAAGYQAAVATAAALAGASRVVAFTRDSKGYPNAAEAARATLALARSADVSERIEIVDHFDSRRWRDVDIVVNCFQVGSISRSIVELLPSHAVISLMAEPWELRPGIVDILACDDLGIRVAAPNLVHPAIELLPQYGRLGGMLLDEAGIEPRDANLAIISDTPCAPFIDRVLRDKGARVSIFPHPQLLTAGPWDAIIVAMRPSDKPPMNINSLGHLFEITPEALLVQFSGEIDRSAASYFGLKVWPPKKPVRGHLGLPLDVLGPGPAIRKLTGGLKAAEVAYRGAELGPGAIGFIVESGARTG
jgi:hypothetical protein